MFTRPYLPFIQPYNIFMGTLVASVIAVGIWNATGDLAVSPWLPAALSVSLSILAMEILNCQHPPAGAFALLYCVVKEVRVLG